MLERWYQCVVANPKDTATRVVMVRGTHLGQCIARAEQKNGRVIAVEPSDAPMGEAVGKVTVERGAGPALMHGADQHGWCRGIVARGLSMPLLPITGYVVHRHTSSVAVEAMTTASSVHDLWLTMIEQMPVIDNIEVKLLSHFGNAAHTDVWLTPRINGKKAVRFLDDHEADISNNGHVEAAAYARHSKSTLRLTEHKTVLWVSDTHSTVAQVESWLATAKIPQVDALPDLSSVPHLHYRIDGSSHRERMEKRVASMKLRRVDRVVA
jgi:hypothetical protein